MDNSMLTKRISSVVTTGLGQIGIKQTQDGASQSHEIFRELLQQKISENSDLTFSKHAASRVLERNVEISDDSITRLSDGVKLAQEKGLNDTLILVDSTAYIVNAKSGTVITTVQNEEIKNNVFTNIEGTVIM